MSVTELTAWYAPNIDPLRIGNYEMINESTGLIFPVFYSGSRWFHSRYGPAVPLVRIWPWRGLTSQARCHASKDGECFWGRCPQIRDGEPAKSGRHCPIDDREEE
jgi:hypothetical protein